jgi:hypothetical protein
MKKTGKFLPRGYLVTTSKMNVPVKEFSNLLDAKKHQDKMEKLFG